jgi:hypothetical protein
MVRKRLPSRSSESGIGAGHSTPIPIDRFLHRQKLSNTSYKVFFDKYPVIPHIGKADDLIKIIEEGARPHDIPVPQIRGKGIDFGLTPMRIFKHPGMEGFHMWKRGMTEFEHSYKALLEERYSHMKRQHWQAPANFNPSFRPANWG